MEQGAMHSLVIYDTGGNGCVIARRANSKREYKLASGIDRDSVGLGMLTILRMRNQSLIDSSPAIRPSVPIYTECHHNFLPPKKKRLSESIFFSPLQRDWR
jgi:hypothetical protein